MFIVEPSQEPIEFPQPIEFKNCERGKSRLAELWEMLDGTLIVRNVTQPELIPFFPSNQKDNNHEAILIAPGGAMMLLAIGNEGVDVAKKLASIGYTAFVLKYRVNPTPYAALDFKTTCEAFIAADPGFGTGNFTGKLDLSVAANDVSDAIRFLQKHSERYSFDRNRIHYLGFSAGAALGYDHLTKHGEHALKSIACMYGPMYEVKLHGSSAPPPLFLSMADDDPLFSRQGFAVIQQWQALKQRVEFHLFERGGHGFGMSKKSNTSDGWFELYTHWLRHQQ